ncbi:MAG: transcriptional regulator [Bdellovibrionota bacterium]
MTRRQILKNTESYHDSLIQSLQDPNELEAYIKVAIEDYQETHDIKSLLVSLRNVAEAKGGMSKLAEKTKLNRQSLYKTLSLNGNPRLNTFEIVLNELGFQLSIQPFDRAS